MKKTSQSSEREEVKPPSYLIVLSLVAATVFPTRIAEATVGNIIQVSRRLKMTNSEPLPAKEFYLNVGRKEGVKIGDTLEVFRDVPVVDSSTTTDWQMVRVKMGEVKVKSIGESTSLAQLSQERGPAELPSFDYVHFMIGDVVELKTSLPFQ